MTTTKALAKLYKTITGLAPRNSAAKILSDLADNWSGGGGTEYTAGDNITISEGVISATDTTYSAATSETAGLVYQGIAVDDAAGDAPTAAEFKALLDSLRDAGVIATAEETPAES